MSAVSDPRILSVWLRRLPADRISRAAPDKGKSNDALVIVAPVKSALRVSALNDAAAKLSLREGISLSDARAMYPSLRVEQGEPEKDAALLKSLGQWCSRYTPLAGLDAPDGLFLDITGCAHLYGSEEALLKDVLTRLKHFGFHARGAIAGSAGCAWALSHYGRQSVVPPGGMRDALMDLPLRSLRIADETVSALNQSGLIRIADILHRPRAPLTARFGKNLLFRLDQALGLMDEPITPLLPRASFAVEQNFVEPITREEDVLTIIALLAERLCAVMERQGAGARALEACLFRVDGKIAQICVAAARPLRDAISMRRLFIDRLASASEDHDAGFGYDMIRLSATRHERFTPQQNGLDADAMQDVSHLIDRVAARLGGDRVLRLMAQDTHVPEFACVTVPAHAASEFGSSSTMAFTSGQDTLGPPRPLRLFARAQSIEVVAEVPDGPPARFRWRRMMHDVARAEGPERIAMEWWRDEGALTRDYFRVEDKSGARFWLYREGLYERETPSPRWYLHGVFA